MGTIQLQKYVWLVDTIRQAKMISLKEINRKWVINRLSNNKEITKKKLQKWIESIGEIFGIEIANERRGEYRYYIENEDQLQKNSASKWLFETISVNNKLLNYKDLHGRILLESVSSADGALTPILDAMQSKKMIAFTYNDYWKDAPEQLEVEPYCVKLAKQRWYVLAHCPLSDNTKAYPIDRISDLKILDDKPFEMLVDFDAEKYFRDYYGATAPSNDTPTEHVKIKVFGKQVKYFRSLPKHHSQKETNTCDGYSIFEYDVKPTYDFQQAILSHAPDVMVLEPQSLREEIRWKVEELNRRYKSK